MRLLAGRLAHLLPVLLLVSLVAFLLLNLLPGDVALVILGPEADPEQLERLRESYGLNDPVLMRYWDWLTNALTGDFGSSFRTNETVQEAVVRRLPVTLQLMLMAQIIAMVLAIPTAIIAAFRSGGRFDKFATTTAFGLISLPHFVLGILLIFLFAILLGWLPPTGYEGPFTDLGENFRRMIMPAVSLAMADAAVYMRLLRSDMISTLQEDYILSAKAKGLPTWHILLRHALRPSSFSLITLAGVNIGRLIGGTVVIEVLFALPGIGRLLIQSIFARDLFVVQGLVFLIAVTFVVANTVVDLLYTRLDPRIREVHVGTH